MPQVQSRERRALRGDSLRIGGGAQGPDGRRAGPQELIHGRGPTLHEGGSGERMTAGRDREDLLASRAAVRDQVHQVGSSGSGLGDAASSATDAGGGVTAFSGSRPSAFSSSQSWAGIEWRISIG